MIAGSGLDVAAWVRDAKTLTPFGALLRYADLDDTRSVDRTAITSLVERVIVWAADRVREIEPI